MIILKITIEFEGEEFEKASEVAYRAIKNFSFSSKIDKKKNLKIKINKDFKSGELSQRGLSLSFWEK